MWWVSHLTGLLSFLNGLLLRERLRLESEYIISLCLLLIRVWLLKTNTHIQLKTGSKSHRWDHLCLVKCCGPVFPPGPPFNFGPILWHKTRVCLSVKPFNFQPLWPCEGYYILVQGGEYPVKTKCSFNQEKTVIKVKIHFTEKLIIIMISQIRLNMSCNVVWLYWLW